jgi:hypothetical protein
MTQLELVTKPDADQAVKRMEHWWNKEILDRPTISVVAPRKELKPMPVSHHSSARERKLDTEFMVATRLAEVENTYWPGELLPYYMPNLGPEILSTAYGCEMEFGEDTSWSIPSLASLDDIDKLRFNPDNQYIQKLLEITRLALEMGKGRFLTGITDLHPGADLAASLRDPQQLCIDIADSPDAVMRLVEAIRPAFFELYKLQDKIIRDAGQTLSTSWLPLWSTGRYYIPSCDFSALISPKAYQRFFLPEILEEIAWLDRSIYHLDGPDALRHLDTLLDIPKLDAIQWVYGDGNYPAAKWIPICQKIQNAGKNLHIGIAPSEIDAFMEALSPEGVMLNMAASSEEEADYLVAKTKRWKSKK